MIILTVLLVSILAIWALTTIIFEAMDFYQKYDSLNELTAVLYIVIGLPSTCFILYIMAYFLKMGYQYLKIM